MNLTLVETTIRRLDDDLVRAQYSLAIHEEIRDKTNLIKQQLVDACSDSSSIVALRHIDLISQQDCALAICRMMDKGKGAHSFWELKNLCHPNRSFLLKQARDKYLNPKHEALAEMMVKDTEGYIDRFVSKVADLNKSKTFIAVRNLRDDTLGHALKVSKGNRPDIGMIKACINELEEILSLSYLIFLQTDYRPQSGYKYARFDAARFWNDFCGI